ncbi:Cytosolic carboxypeptidase-like protein 5 [Papilio machaon]|uniref:Cytosolic carboxypeptidase-like protein 5 n=1 Tax=Papilio machaon TaxID=76193 RepID=A0A0N1PJ56_PAPMA|nr:Cytosolic carboxypeptidase-like protein 5 [Papilio machaon]
MDNKSIIECAGFYFIHNFDSGNLGHVEQVPSELIETPEYEFNLWTRPDCAGTEFENGNRTWFYFGIQASQPGVLVRLNLINLNKQGKMYNQGMAPVTRTLPGKPQWERIKDRPVHSTDDNTFTLSFKYKTSDNPKATTFFAFTYPYSFAELQLALNAVDGKLLPLPAPQSPDDIYYCRECLTYSLEGRRVDLLTITSHHGITAEREERLKNLFPENQERPFKFQNKKVIFISARVHPGETPSSFVFNGFLSLLSGAARPGGAAAA